MRAAAIFGPVSSIKDLKPFQKNSEAAWLVDLPRSADQADAILVFGGDGTVHRHLAQLVKLQLPVLVVPCGSGNDFANALSLRSFRIALAAWLKFCSGGGNVRMIDLGVITPLIADRRVAAELPVPHYFCCVGGVGLDAEISRRANRLPRWLRASGGYALSLLLALWRFAPVATTLALPGVENPDVLVSRNTQATIVTAFANAPSYGGGMKIAPQAQLDDGRLDVCVIRQINKFKLLCLFPTVYFGGHLSIPQVEYFQTERLKIETEAPQDVYADGEYVCRTPIEVSVARKALRVIVP
ncbi:MAG TPA: diacylglycerol kinase family protein [Terriglobales bacterium]|nr:diacylglycerol kinase family protein [Terriglobales bacterium]